MAQVPDLSPEWPPTADQLATLLMVAHWETSDLAWDVPRGKASKERLARAADAFEALAKLMRNHEPVERKEAAVPDQPEQDERETPGQQWVADVAAAARREELPPTREE